MVDKREKLDFCTGSSYHGRLNADGQMEGFGMYRFADGSVYEGGFKNGEFHGDGTITLPSKFKLRGIFTHGQCNDYKMEFGDGIEYKMEDWDYCVYPDRRFAISIHNGIPPVGRGHLTSSCAPREIPADYFDIEEGFYSPNYDYVWSAEDPSLKLRVVPPVERRNILKYFRNTINKPVGFQQDIIDENVLALHELFGPDGRQVSCSTSTDSAETKFYRDDNELRLSSVEIQSHAPLNEPETESETEPETESETEPETEPETESETESEMPVKSS